MKLTIYVASEAFLYLPAYIAKHWKIFETVLDTLIEGEANFLVADGDADAIHQMLLKSEESDSISIAIADPTVFL